MYVHVITYNLDWKCTLSCAKLWSVRVHVFYWIYMYFTLKPSDRMVNPSTYLWSAFGPQVQSKAWIGIFSSHTHSFVREIATVFIHHHLVLHAWHGLRDEFLCIDTEAEGRISVQTRPEGPRPPLVAIGRSDPAMRSEAELARIEPK